MSADERGEISADVLPPFTNQHFTLEVDYGHGNFGEIIETIHEFLYTRRIDDVGKFERRLNVAFSAKRASTFILSRFSRAQEPAAGVQFEPLCRRRETFHLNGSRHREQESLQSMRPSPLPRSPAVPCLLTSDRDETVLRPSRIRPIPVSLHDNSTQSSQRFDVTLIAPPAEVNLSTFEIRFRMTNETIEESAMNGDQAPPTHQSAPPFHGRWAT